MSNCLELCRWFVIASDLWNYKKIYKIGHLIEKSDRKNNPKTTITANHLLFHTHSVQIFRCTFINEMSSVYRVSSFKVRVF